MITIKQWRGEKTDIKLTGKQAREQNIDDMDKPAPELPKESIKDPKSKNPSPSKGLKKATKKPKKNKKRKK